MTLEERVKATLGEQAMAILVLQAQVDLLQTQLAKCRTENAVLKAANESGTTEAGASDA